MKQTELNRKHLVYGFFCLGNYNFKILFTKLKIQKKKK